MPRSSPGATLAACRIEPRLAFRTPDRRDLPTLDRYAMLRFADGRRRVAGYTEASRGCKHLCRHCPVVPVYRGRFRVVPVHVVLADVRQQVAAGAEHVTFGDADFFNGIGHALSVVEAVHRDFPDLTYDVTIKVEHLLTHRPHLRRLAETGCLLVTTAVESVDDEVLARLQKGHTRAEVERVIAWCREAGLGLAPTFVAFTPWTTLRSYCDLLDTIESWDLIDDVASIQLALRLLVPRGSGLLDLVELRDRLGAFDERLLAYPWVHPDEHVDALQREVETIVATTPRADRRALFERISALAHARAGVPRAHPFAPGTVRARSEIAWLDEPWYC